MTTSTTYPNGQVLQSSALMQAQISTLLQTLTYGMLGLTAPSLSTWQPVQVDWQTQGQPASQGPQIDVCYISCVTQDEPYTKVRDRTFSGVGPVTETWVYTRCWRINWVLYGPNSTDRARAIWSAMFMDYFNDALSLQNLYPVSDFDSPVRAPELVQAQWWDRSDFSISLYEQVTETIQDTIATQVEVKVYDGSPTDPVADITVSPRS